MSKQIRTQAEEVGGKFILITNEAFPERFKPAAHDFNPCESGRPLIIAPTLTFPVSRENYLRMNALAEWLVGFPPFVKRDNTDGE
ncbi:MAG: hypothetical protein HDR80_09385 [Bacteroides sp.]|nr:hypothetical protein [Bacteroides sp.]